MEEEEYVPEYAKGEILVCYLDKANPGEDFGVALGFEVSENSQDYEFARDNLVIYRVPPGEEEEAVKKFESYKEFVDWAEKRDLKWERRRRVLDGLEIKVREIEESLSDKSWDNLMKKSLSDFLS